MDGDQWLGVHVSCAGTRLTDLAVYATVFVAIPGRKTGRVLVASIGGSPRWSFGIGSCTMDGSAPVIESLRTRYAKVD